MTFPLPPDSGSHQNWHHGSEFEVSSSDRDGDIDYALSLRDRQLRALFEGSLDAMVVVDDEGGCLDANPAAWELLGIDHEQLDHPLQEFWGGAAAGPRFLEPGQLSGEQVLVRADGSRREIEYSVTAHFLPHRHLVVLRDVSERRRMERSLYSLNQELQQLNQQLEARVVERTQALEVEIKERQQVQTVLSDILDSAIACIASFRIFPNRDWVYDYYSAGSLEVFGYPPAEFMANKHFWIDRVLPEDMEAIWPQLWESLLAERSVKVEYRFRHRDGSLRWIRSHHASRYDPDAQCWVVTCVCTDISDRKHAESRLQESQTRLKETQRISQVGGWSIDLATGHCHWSEETYRIHGLPQDDRAPDILGHLDGYLDFYPGEARTQIQTAFQQLLATGEPYDLEVPFVTAQQRPRWVRTQAALVRQQGRPVRVVGNIIDITERKQAELALRRKTEELEGFFCSAIDLLCIASLDGYFLRLNPEWERTLGYPLEQLEGRRFLDYVHGEDRAATLEALKQLTQGQSLSHFVNRYCHRTGDYRWIEWRAIPVGDVIYATARDITEAVRIRRALEASEYRLNLALTAANAGLWEWDISSGKVHWSEMNFRLMGYLPGSCQPSYDNWLAAVHPDDRLQTEQAVQQVLEQGGELYWRYRVRWPDGTVRWLCDIGQIIYDAQGRPQGMIGLQLDITESQQMKLALEESEARFRAFMDASPMVAFVNDAEGRIVYANAYCERIMGGSQANLLGKTLDGWLSEELARPIQRNSQQVLDTAELAQFIESFPVSSSGQPHQWLVQKFPLFSGDQRLVGGVALDITHLSLPTVGAVLQENIFHNAFVHAGIGMALVSTTGHFLQVNQSFCEMTGYSEAELLARDFGAITHPEDLDTDWGYARQLLRGEIRSYQMEKRYFHKQGHVIWGLLTGSLLRNQAEEPVYFVAQIQDITARKQAQMALAESEARFHAFMEQSPVVAWVTNAQGQVQFASRCMVHLMGYESLEEIRGMTLAELFPEETASQYQRDNLWLITHQQSFEGMDCVRMPDGRDRNYWVSKFPIRYPSGEWLAGGIAIDVTERLQAEQELQHSEAVLQEAQHIAHLGSWSLEVSSQRITWSNELFRIFGLNPGQPVPTLFEQLQQLYPEDRPRWQQTLAAALETGEPYVLTFRIWHQDGQLRTVEVRGQGRQNAQGQVVELFGTVQDITDWQQMQEALRSQLDREQALTRMIQAIRNSLDLQAIFATATREIGQLTRADRVGILQYCPDEQLWRNVADYRSRNDLASVLGLEIPAENNPLSAQLQAGQVVNISSAAQLDDPVNAELARHYPGSWLIVPLYTGDQLWGALNLINHCAELRWQEPEVSLLQTVAGQLAIAIQQANLYRQVQQELAERQRVESALREQEEQYRLLFNKAEDLIFVHAIMPTGESPLIAVNDRACQMLGYSREELLQKSPRDLVPADQQADLPQIHRTLLAQGSYLYEHTLITHDGQAIPVENHAHRFTYRDQIACLTISRDITERRAAEAQMRYNALHDPLTQLPNRSFLMARLEQVLQRMHQQPQRQFAVLFLDLDRFKLINDSLGHLSGDQLLVKIAEVLTQTIRPTDLAGRLGGDEFVVVLQSVDTLQEVVQVARRLLARLRQSFTIAGREVTITTSIGIVVGSRTYEAPDHLLRDADIAMYQAKANGKDCYALFNPGMHAQILRQLQLEHDLRQALQREEFVLFYQPIVDLGTGTLAGFEALVRWQHPQHGLIFPGEFIDTAEETGLIVPLGRWILKAACQQLRRWQQQLPHSNSLRVSVNLSAEQLHQDLLPQYIASVLEDTGIDGSQLVLEMTESILIDHTEDIIACIEALRAMDIRLAIDDFGTGYSSLSYLHQFPISALKIDKSFIFNMGADATSHNIVQTIVTLADRLGLVAIAEGIETRDQIHWLQKMACELGQGYRFARPLSAADATDLLAANPTALPAFFSPGTVEE